MGHRSQQGRARSLAEVEALMDTNTHTEAVLAVIAAARLLEKVDLSEAINAAEHAAIVAPMIDPTLWRENGNKLAEDIELMRKAKPLWLWAKEARERHDARVQSGS